MKKWKCYWRASQHNKLGQDAQTPWLGLKKNYNHTLYLISLKLLTVLTICCLLYSAALTFPFLFNFHHGIDSNVLSLGIIWEEFYHVPWASWRHTQLSLSKESHAKMKAMNHLYSQFHFKNNDIFHKSIPFQLEIPAEIF